jgi:hypothetical protein
LQGTQGPVIPHPTFPNERGKHNSGKPPDFHPSPGFKAGPDDECGMCGERTVTGLYNVICRFYPAIFALSIWLHFRRGLPRHALQDTNVVKTTSRKRNDTASQPLYRAPLPSLAVWNWNAAPERATIQHRATPYNSEAPRGTSARGRRPAGTPSFCSRRSRATMLDSPERRAATVLERRYFAARHEQQERQQLSPQRALACQMVCRMHPTDSTV